MPLQRLHPGHAAGSVVSSIVIATYASYVALDLVRRIRNDNYASGVPRMAGGALVMGTGIWSTHFIGMLAMKLPIAVTYDPALMLVSWLAAVSFSFLSLLTMACDRSAYPVWWLGAITMGGGICVVYYIDMMAMMLTPAIRWHGSMACFSAMIALIASTIALRIFFSIRRLNGWQAFFVQAAAAVILGVAIVGMHYTGMAAADFSPGAISQTINGIGGHNLGTMVVVASLMLLSITLSTSVLDARQQARAFAMAQSLEQANAELQGANARLKWMAFRDPVTGLPDRAHLEDRLDIALQRLGRRGDYPDTRMPTKLAMMLIDLDGFKPVNDSYGHAFGDQVLRQISIRLNELTSDNGTAARIGGDEFLTLVEDIQCQGDAVAFAQRILHSVSTPMWIAGREFSLSCSIGIAIFPDQVACDRLISSADAAMHVAKHNGGNGYAVYAPHMHVGATDQMDMQQALRGAIERQEFQLHYQPKIDGRLGDAVGFEALLRWRNDDLGAVLPKVFIPVAERFGLINAIGDWVIEAVCRQLATWRSQGRYACVAINLSGYQLRQSGLIARMKQLFDAYAIDPRQIVCEVTESVAMEDIDSTQCVLRQLAELGVSLSIDDFGTGYSSLAYLRQLRVQQLKIDRSFILDLDSSADARALVEAVIGLAHGLGLRVVAEGVETAAQYAALKALECDEMQGYFFARPMAADALRDAGFLPVSAPS